jgi:RNA polymerase sigma-70 factor, ECF subfamily
MGLENRLSWGNVLSLEHPAKERRLTGPDDPGAASDADLVEGCKFGKISAYEQLYRVHGPRMKSIALNLLGNASDAEDAIQEAFLKIYRSVGNFKGESAFTTWIYRVLVNTCYDLRRKHRRRHETAELDADPGGIHLAPGVSDHPLRLTLQKCLAHLHPRNRAFFLLFEVEGFKHREIAEILSIPEGTSKNLLFEAKRELQRMLWESAHSARTHAS